jgi:hypothetical protein
MGILPDGLILALFEETGLEPVLLPVDQINKMDISSPLNGIVNERICPYL